MADNQFTTPPIVINEIAFNGGLNSTAGPFAVGNNESTDLQNVDFNIFGSILKRNGYLNVNASAIATANSDGLYWFEYQSGGATARKLINVTNGKFYKMDTSSGEPDGTWDDATNGRTITADNFCDFVTWHNSVFVTNGNDAPLVYTGATLSLTTATLPSGVTKPKYTVQFNNYQFYLNVYVGGVKEASRFYWSEFNDHEVWPATYFIRVSDNDGTDITGAKVLSDRLVVFKDRSIYNVYYTADSQIPFVVQKSNSAVGCVSAESVQEVQNGLVFLSQDGFYFYDGNNSYKISDKVSETVDSYIFSSAKSCVQNLKNRYFCAMQNKDTSYGVFVWDFFNNAWSVYKGLTVSAMTRVFIGGTDERPYFADNSGFTYRMDIGIDDYPLGVQTAIDAYYYTNWKPFQDLVLQKGVPQAVIYHTIQDGTVEFVYSYDFEEQDMYSETINMLGESMLWDEDSWDEAEWSKAGGKSIRMDLTGRGRVVRFGFKNNIMSDTFRIDGLGLYVRGETFAG
jgi:hypothetical protein